MAKNKKANKSTKNRKQQLKNRKRAEKRALNKNQGKDNHTVIG
jgi:hypothetical protein